jgi:hypothetical protein
MKEVQADYLRFAVAARQEAMSVGLENVRQKHLLSAATWEGLARTAAKVAETRARRADEHSAAIPGISP